MVKHHKHHIQKLKTHTSELSTRQKVLFFVLAFSVIGGITLLITNAATPTSHYETESSSLTGNVITVSDTTASSGRAIQFGGTSVSGAWSDSNPPWALKAGESLDENIPVGAKIYNYNDYTNSGTRSLSQTLDEIRRIATTDYYVRLPAGTFTINDFHYGAQDGRGAGYQDTNSRKFFNGLIGAGADKTFIVIAPSIMSTAQKDAVAAGVPSPVQVRGIYAGSNANGGIATIFSGITFRGNFQQSTTLAGLSGTAPAPYQGLFLFESRPGSFIQYSRFQGFGFVAKASPPYETGAVESLRANYTIRRVEIDGRQASEINSARPVSSGGLMWNREKNVKVVDSWLHHTRRSGWATHDNATHEGGNQNDPGIYYSENFQVENIANTLDAFAGTSLGFAISNVEEVRRTFTWVKPRFNLGTSSNAHIVLGTTYGNMLAESLSVSDPVITDNVRGGCLIIRVIKQPNSLGINPYYSAYQTGGFAALPITVSRNGVKLTPVLSTQFNATTHTPDKYYVVIMG